MNRTLAEPVTGVVIVSSALSALSGLLLALTCGMACAFPPSERSPKRYVQLCLCNLGLADFTFASSFLLAQLRDDSQTGGPVCYAAAVLNEYAGVTSALWTATLAWTIRCALVRRRSFEFFWDIRRRRLLPLVVWLMPLAVEAALFASIYYPEQLLGPEPELPWCHWHKGGVDLSLLLYGVVALTMSYCALCYWSVIRHHIVVGRQAAALLRDDERLAAYAADAGTADADVGQGLPAEGATRWPSAAAAGAGGTAPRARSLDLRLGSYVMAFTINQLPSLVHRLWQVWQGSPPRAVAIAQALTQPAQGLLNAAVYLHHGASSNLCAGCAGADEGHSVFSRCCRSCCSCCCASTGHGGRRSTSTAGLSHLAVAE